MTLTTTWQELGSITLYSTIGIFIDGKLDSQSDTGNYSIARFRFRNGNTAWRTTSGEASFTGSFTDSQSVATYPNNIPIGGTIFEIVKTINHNEDGNRTLSVGGTIYAYINGGRRSATINQVEVVLPKINRQSTWTSSLLSIPNIESSFTLQINKYVSEYYNVVEIRNSNDTILIKTIDDVLNGDSVTLSSSELNTIYTMDNNTNQLPLRFYMNLITYTDSTKSTQIGTTQRLTCEAFLVNSEQVVTYQMEETDENVLDVFGGQPNVVIKYASDLLFSINATPQHGSTIASVKVNNTNAVLDNVYKATIENATSDTYEIKVTDSRGLVTTIPKNVTLVDYIPTNINAGWTIERESPVSSNLILNATINAYNDYLDEDHLNAVAIQYSVDGTTWTTIPSSSYTYVNNLITISDLTLSDLIPYNQTGRFYLKSYDSLTESNDNEVVAVGIETISYGERDFQVNGDLIVCDEDGENPVNILNRLNKIGKLLWTGSFSSGSITVDGLSEYNIIAVVSSYDVMLFGNKNFGLGGYTQYGSYSYAMQSYRFNVSGNTLTIDNENVGISDGYMNIPATKIYGIA